MGKAKEFGSQADLVKNEAGMGANDIKMVNQNHNKAHLSRTASRTSEFETVRPDQKVLTTDEKTFLLYVERGDVAYVKRMVKAFGDKRNIFDINCTDPLGRSGLIIAIENENMEMMQFLIEAGIEPRDSILVAIREDYVEGVELLLQYEEETHKDGEQYSWEKIDQVTANFTPDVTPLILAAHRNNFEILKMLLDRGATIPMPHDVKCSCEECVESSSDDSLRFSLARINAYKALASPSLIALSSKDPIITAFQLSNELKRLAVMESQFREEYRKLRKQCQEFAVGLVEHARTSYELEVLLNHNPGGQPWEPGTHQTLGRLELAIDSNQKNFVAHPSVQQLLAAIWYDGLPGFRRLHIVRQLLCVVKHACMFPIFSTAYMLAPQSRMGQLAKKPFLKFIFQSASYMFFLFLLALASQQIEHIIFDIITFLFPNTVLGNFFEKLQNNWRKYERGSLPTPIELIIIVWVQGLIWKSLKEVYHQGLLEYLMDLWNLADIMSYGSFMGWIGLRAISFAWVLKLQFDGVPEDEIWSPREQWHPFDPMLLSEGLFGAGMISSYLKLIQIFSINPYLGPLQVSLGKMIIDICKFLVLYILVLFSFGCGLNNLLWYYADLEKQKCYSLEGGLPDWEEQGDSCVMWRRFANLWETSQSLFWASFGLVELGDFELTGIKEFTRFWGLLMFGSYSVCNIIVLLNMLIAMMSNSYTIISERSDVEWKFARSRLWISYFEEGSTVPPPFNMIPTPKSIFRFLKCGLCKDRTSKYTQEDQEAADARYFGVIRCLVRRYITSEQRKSENTNITEDDINEVRQDIRTFRYELINVLKMNNFKTPNIQDKGAIGKKSKNLERQIQKGFQISKAEGKDATDIFALTAMKLHKQFSTASRNSKGSKRSSIRSKAPLTGKQKFKGLALKAIKQEHGEDEEATSPIRVDPIGSTATSIRRRNRSLRRSLIMRGNSLEDAENICLSEMNTDQLVTYNPRLASFTPTTRIAYARFKNALKNQTLHEDDEDAFKTPTKPKKSTVNIENEKPNGQVVALPASPDDKAKTLGPARGQLAVKSKTPGPSPGHEPKKEVERKVKSADPSPARPNLPPPSSPQPPPTPKKSPIKEPTTKVPLKETPKEPEKEPPKTPKKEQQTEKEPPKTPKKEEPSKTPRKEPSKATEKKEEAKKEEASAASGTTKPPPSPSVASSSVSKSPRRPIVEVQEDEETKFDPKGKSISTGRSATGWL